MLIVQLDERFLQWAKSLLENKWGGLPIISRGQAHIAHRLPGFVALIEDQPVGLATYRIDQSGCELISLNSLRQKTGIGTALLEAVIGKARMYGCGRVWLITTNDNLPALRFYQRRGFSLAALYPRAIEDARLIKSSIPFFGIDGIPIRDEIELEMALSQSG